MRHWAKIEDGVVTVLVVSEAAPTGFVEVPAQTLPGFTVTDEGYLPPDILEPSPVVPDRVTSRQFKMQLELAGLTSAVEGWITAQETLVQIAYNNSGTFVRDEPMMVAGMTALGFTPEQIDAFFLAASAL